jgi:hypothetical protein
MIERLLSQGTVGTIEHFEDGIEIQVVPRPVVQPFSSQARCLEALVVGGDRFHVPLPIPNDTPFLPEPIHDLPPLDLADPNRNRGDEEGKSEKQCYPCRGDIHGWFSFRSGANEGASRPSPPLQGSYDENPPSDLSRSALLAGVAAQSTRSITIVGVPLPFSGPSYRTQSWGASTSNQKYACGKRNRNKPRIPM